MSVFWCMELDLFSLKCNEVNFEASMIWHGLRAGHLLMLTVMFLFCWRISMVCLALEPFGSWVELDFSVGVDTFG